MAARKQKKQRRKSAQVVEDEDDQLRYEVVAGIDVAEGVAVVCVRTPPAQGGAPDVAPAGGGGDGPGDRGAAVELKAAGVHTVSMEATRTTGACGSRGWRRPGWRCSW